MRLANKIGIVTAAASGMGRAGAVRFAQEGAAVGVVDLDEAGANAVARQITDDNLRREILSSRGSPRAMDRVVFEIKPRA